ncbi:MAG: NAD-dependent dehydratase, partial [Pseudaminobacter sp.]
PTTTYGRSKREAEQHVGRLAESGILALSLRPPLVVGAEAKGNWASLQKLAVSGIPLPFGSVRNARSFISVHSLSEAISHLCSATWSNDLSGEYCLADPGFLSLPDVITDLRAGMGIGSRLLPCPPVALEWFGIATGRRRQIAGLIGDLKVDPSRFMERFQFAPSLPIREAIRQSGADYRRQVRRGKA